MPCSSQPAMTIEFQFKMADKNDMSDTELRNRLSEYGENPGPITDTTRKLWLKKLNRLAETKDEEVSQPKRGGRPRKTPVAKKVPTRSRSPGRRKTVDSSEQQATEVHETNPFTEIKEVKNTEVPSAVVSRPSYRRRTTGSKNLVPFSSDEEDTVSAHAGVTVNGDSSYYVSDMQSSPIVTINTAENLSGIKTPGISPIVSQSTANHKKSNHITNNIVHKSPVTSPSSTLKYQPVSATNNAGLRKSTPSRPSTLGRSLKSHAAEFSDGDDFGNPIARLENKKMHPVTKRRSYQVSNHAPLADIGNSLDKVETRFSTIDSVINSAKRPKTPTEAKLEPVISSRLSKMRNEIDASLTQIRNTFSRKKAGLSDSQSQSSGNDEDYEDGEDEEELDVEFRSRKSLHQYLFGDFQSIMVTVAVLMVLILAVFLKFWVPPKQLPLLSFDGHKGISCSSII